MRTVSIFKNGKSQAIRFPKDLEFVGVTELEISRQGDVIILRPVRPDWSSLAEVPSADATFMMDRLAVVDDEGHLDW